MTKTSILIVSTAVVLILVIALFAFRHNSDRGYSEKAVNMVESLKNGDYQNAARDVSPGGMTPQQLRLTWDGVIAKDGPLKEYSIVKMGPIDNDPNQIYGVRFNCKFATGPKWVTIKFRTSGSINYLAIRPPSTNPSDSEW